GIVEKINVLIGEKKTEKISTGKVVKAMILNGMGLVSSPLYIFKDFFEGKAAEHLLGEEVKAEYLNDDRLGRVLDKMYEIGLNQIFVFIVLEIIKKYQLNVEAVHLDSSSFKVHGEYKNSGDHQTIEITYGYSRDKRPDLKIFVMELIIAEDGDVPLWIKITSGNSSDQKQFGAATLEFKKQLKFDSLMVADSAFYTQENLQIAKEIKWLSRVPLTVKAARELVKSVDSKDLNNNQNPGYSSLEVWNKYGAVEQRWLLVESEKRKESDLKKLEKKIKKDWQASRQKLRELSSQEFACTAQKSSISPFEKVQISRTYRLKSNQG
ncbi:MAG: IS1634 family transposase, partial [Okeania sp. SIO2H7]|nr:IS1634 family transposase [Okeania sp. SIO2H7]